MFDQHSKGIIDQCFVKDNDFAMQLLDCKTTIPIFNQCIPLDIAPRSHCKTFLASNAVQKYLDDKWYRDFDHQQELKKIPVFIWVCQSFD